VLVLGHRGSPAEALENTLESFEAAVAAGADGIECDVRGTRDGGLLLHHDEKLVRTAGRPEALRQLSLKEVLGVRLLGGGRIPTVDEALDVLSALARRRGRRLLVDLEIKEADLAAAVPSLLRRREDRELDLLITSFDARAVAAASRAGGRHRTGLLDRGRRPRPVAVAQRAGASWLAACQGSVGAVRRARVVGLRTLVWTVDEPAEACRYRDEGVDALCTNAPRLLVGVLR
jgi:glycerophosphoryl diester phosphodiesterase